MFEKKRKNKNICLSCPLPFSFWARPFLGTSRWWCRSHPNHVELTSEMHLEDTLATDLMMGLDKDLTPELLAERLSMRKLDEFGCGNGAESIEQAVLDDCLLGPDRKNMQDEFEAEQKRETSRRARSTKINDLVKTMIPKLKKNRRPACKVKSKVIENNKKNKRWWP